MAVAVLEGRALQGSDKAYRYAQGGIARGGATRGNYHRPTVFIAIGGVQYGEGRANPAHRVLLESLSITDALNEDPNTLAMRTKGFVPQVGAEVVITLGSQNNLRREFGGRISQTAHTYWDNPKQDEYGVSAIDYTWGLNTRKVTGRYSGSASDIAIALIAEWAPGYTAKAVAAGLATVEGGITFTNQEMTDCLGQLAKRVGAAWYIDYFRDLHLFLTETGATDPQPLTLAHPTARELAIRRDASQWVTRAIVEGGGVTAMGDVAVGENCIPVETTAWYAATGGLVTAGPQRVRYTGVSAGGGGALVGPGASPTSPLTAALGATAGALEAGVHTYTVTFETAAGESAIGPQTQLVVGALPPPASAPTVGAPLVGAGPNPGTHDYAVTFVTATGETLPGPRVTASTGTTPPPAAAPTPAAAIGAGLPAGGHYYVVTFLTSIGETTPGPASGLVSTGVAPGNAPAPGMVSNGPNASVADQTVGHTYAYGVCWSTAAGQTVHSEQTALVSTAAMPALATTASVPNAGAPTLVSNGPNDNQGDLTPGHDYRYGVCYSTEPASTAHAAQTALVSTMLAKALASNTNPAKASPIVVSVPLGPAGVQWAHLYRVDQTLVNPANAADYRLVTSIANGAGGGAAQFSDTLATAAIAGNHAPNQTNTSYAGKASPLVVDVPYGPSGTQWVHLYRVDQTAVGGGNVTDYRLLASFPNGTYGYTTRFTDTLANTAIAGNHVPNQTNTAQVAGLVNLSSIPKGNASVTGRRIYRSEGGAYGYVGTLADNTTTAWTDSVATLGAAPPAASTAYAQQLPVTNVPVGGPLVTGRRLYRSAANATALQLAASLTDNTTTAWTDTLADASLGAAPPAVATAVASAVQLSAIPTGPAAVVARRLYRTAKDATPLKFLVRLADNATTSYLDTIADASLGAAPPTSDLSGLKQPEGAVNPGATELPVSGAGWAPSGGGWVVIGNGQQVVRYHGVSGNYLTGVPASGPGAITAAISFNSSITTAPLLTGILHYGDGRIRYPIVKGDDINVLAIVDDAASQQALAAQIGGDGIQEEFLQDRRLSLAEATARGQALLRLHGALEIAVHFSSRDLNTRSGRRLVVDLGAPFNLRTELKIQRASSTYAMPGQWPLYLVEASSALFSFEDLLRLARLTRGT